MLSCILLLQLQQSSCYVSKHEGEYDYYILPQRLQLQFDCLLHGKDPWDKYLFKAVKKDTEKDEFTETSTSFNQKQAKLFEDPDRGKQLSNIIINIANNFHRPIKFYEKKELESSSSSLGYRALWHRLMIKHNVIATR